MADETYAHPQALHHVRLTVTDIGRAKQFYGHLTGAEPAFDETDKAGDPQARQDPAQLYAGVGFQVGDQLLGLRPGAADGDRFDPTRVGLDHVSLAVGSVDDLHAAARRLDDAGVEHGEVRALDGMGMTIMSVQDPDGINLELTAPSA